MTHVPVIKKLGWWCLLASVGIWHLSFASAFTKAWRRRTAAKQYMSLSTTPRENRYNTPFIIVHVESVRDESIAPWTLEGLMESATEWRNTLHPSNCLLLAVDNHGGRIPSLHTGGPLGDNVGVLFSGNTTNIENVIVSLIQGSSSEQTTVVTADAGLWQECLQLSDKSVHLELIEPDVFSRQIESLRTKNYTLRLAESQATDAHVDKNDNDRVSSIRQQVTLQQELDMLNRLLNPRGTRPNGKRKQISKKQRMKLVGRRDLAKELLQELNQLQSPTQKRDSTYLTESTHERQLLAEQLRRRLDRAGTISRSFSMGEPLPCFYDILWKAKRNVLTGESITHDTTQCDNHDQSITKDGHSLSYSVLKVLCRRLNCEGSNDDNVPPRLLRIVTISDTHGYEHELFAHTSQGESAYLLPSADILLHCGDFSESGSRKVKLQAKARLDAFLAAQSHIPTKIVLRGNHDPHVSARVLFPRSKAKYVTRPMTMILPHNITLELRPFSRRGTIPLLPPCDILASHEPPFGILDLTYQGTRAGSVSLRRAVESCKDKPSIWLCGHIHEGRGSILHTFVDQHTEASSAKTLVVNAANANAGRANRLVTGPVVVDILEDASNIATTTPSSSQRFARSDIKRHMAFSDKEGTY